MKSLIESYHATDIDFFAEILQNSVDALEDRFGEGGTAETPRIEVRVDPAAETVTICDNGPGLPDDVIQKLARPNFTNKEGKRRRGHKGVGLSFAAWTSRSFHFATKRESQNQIVHGKLVGGSDWIAGRVDQYPKIEEDPDFHPPFLDACASGTVFQFVVEGDGRVTVLIRRLNDKGIELLMRTLTAVGYAGLPGLDRASYPEWVKSCRLSIEVAGGSQQVIEPGYLYPHELFGRDSFNIADLPRLSIERQQRLYHKKKSVYAALGPDEILRRLGESDSEAFGDIVREQRVAVYGVFVDTAARFKEQNDALYGPAPGSGRKRQLFRPGIHFITATMPAGEILDVDVPWGSGNKDRLYVVVQMTHATPDLGRKTFDSRTVDMAQRLSLKLLQEYFVPNRQLLIEHQRPHGPTEAEQVMAVDRLKTTAITKQDLGLVDLGILKAPYTEQDVVALFHALLGKGHLKGYQVLSVYGSTQKYDGVFRYRLERRDENLDRSSPLGLPPESFGDAATIEFPASILEFKPSLANLVTDFEGGYKSFEDILLAVAWDEGDQEAFTGSSQYRLETLEPHDPQKQLHGETHLLSTTGLARKIHVMLLKDVVQSLIGAISGV